jgi:peptide/nickel transport system substrate-binding protein
VLGLLVAGCGEQARQATPETATEPVNGGTVVIGVVSEPDNLLDVTSTTRGAQDVIDQMFQTLTGLTADLGGHEADLALSWDLAEDGLGVTFHLDPGAHWHDGVPVTSDDVLFTYDLHTDPVVAYAARPYKEFITEIRADDAHTVTFRFGHRYPYQVFDASVGAILPKHLLESVPREELVSCDFARNPVGSGPFKFRRWVPSQTVELVANESFSQGRPHLDRVVFQIVQEKTTLLTLLETGAIDVMEDVPPFDVARLEKSDRGLRIERFLDRTYTYIGWDSTNPLFSSKRVRRALGMAIDRQGIIDALCYGFARPCLGPIHPILWAYDDTLEPLLFDPAEARRILAEEGWSDTDGDGVLDKNGVPFSFELKTNLGNQVRMDAAVIVQSQLAKIGVAASPRNYEWTVLWDSVIKHQYETAVMVGWSVALKVDLKPIFHTDSLQEKYNHTGYSNPRVDELIEQAESMPTFEEARPLWVEAQREIVADQPYTFLFILDKIFGVSDRIHGTVPDARSYYIHLRDWWIPLDRQHRRGA